MAGDRKGYIPWPHTLTFTLTFTLHFLTSTSQKLHTSHTYTTTNTQPDLAHRPVSNMATIGAIGDISKFVESFEVSNSVSTD